MPKKVCPGKGCNNLIGMREKRCSTCAPIKKAEKADHDKIYNAGRRNTTTAIFYNSPTWKKVRNAVMLRDHKLCINCLNETRITQAKLVHHIIETSETLNFALRFDNLISLCDQCHRDVHAAYNQDKEREQERLRKLLPLISESYN